MSRWTHREYKTRLAHIKSTRTEPTQTEFYLMQIAGEIRHVLSKKRKYKLTDFELRFENKEAAAKKPKMSREQATRISKMLWMRRLGITPDNK